MSDRTWFAVHVRKKDVPAFKEIVFRGARCIEEPADSQYRKDKAVYLLYENVEFTDYVECQDAAQSGLVFEGGSGPGERHNATRFCGNDGKFYHVATLCDGTLAVLYDEEKHRISPYSLSALERYLTAYHRVQPELGAKRRRRQ